MRKQQSSTFYYPSRHYITGLSLAALLVALFFARQAPAQNAPQTQNALQAPVQNQTTLRQDAGAIAVLNSALTAMGGTAAWSQIADATVTGACQMPDPQGGPPLVTSNFVWVTQQSQFRYEADYSSDNSVYLSAQGNPILTTTTTSTPLTRENNHLRLPFHLPGVPMQSMLSDGLHTLTLEGQETLDGVEVVHIRSALFSRTEKLQGSQQDWWFSSTTGLPVKVAYVLPSDDNTHFVHWERTFGSWSQEGSVTVPHQLTDSLDGQIVLQACTVQSVAFNTNPAATLFNAR